MNMNTVLLKTGMAEALDYALTNGTWTIENDIALIFFFCSPLIVILFVTCIIYLIYRLAKWGFYYSQH